MNNTTAPKNSPITITGELADKVIAVASGTYNSPKRMTALLLDYALREYDAGRIEIREVAP